MVPLVAKTRSHLCANSHWFSIILGVAVCKSKIHCGNLYLPLRGDRFSTSNRFFSNRASNDIFADLVNILYQERWAQINCFMAYSNFEFKDAFRGVRNAYPLAAIQSIISNPVVTCYH
jgi:hypothetical protein